LKQKAESLIDKLDLLSEIILESPKEPSNYYNRAIILYVLERFEEAERDFTKAISLDENNSLSYFNRGTFYLNQKRYKEARADLLKSVRLNSKFAEAHYNLACVFVNIFNYREAVFALDCAVNLDRRYLNIARKDPDFQKISKMKEFQEIMMKI